MLRKYMLLWHPDRFGNKYGKFAFEADDLDRLYDKVQWVSQELSVCKVELDEDAEKKEVKEAAKRDKEEAEAQGEGGAHT